MGTTSVSVYSTAYNNFGTMCRTFPCLLKRYYTSHHLTLKTLIQFFVTTHWLIVSMLSFTKPTSFTFFEIDLWRRKFLKSLHCFRYYLERMIISHKKVVPSAYAVNLIWTLLILLKGYF